MKGRFVIQDLPQFLSPSRNWADLCRNRRTNAKHASTGWTALLACLKGKFSSLGIWSTRSIELHVKWTYPEWCWKMGTFRVFLILCRRLELPMCYKVEMWEEQGMGAHIPQLGHLLKSMNDSIIDVKINHKESAALLWAVPKGGSHTHLGAQGNAEIQVIQRGEGPLSRRNRKTSPNDNGGGRASGQSEHLISTTESPNSLGWKELLKAI